MSVADRDTVGSQFIITFGANHHLDRFVYIPELIAFGFFRDVCRIVLNLAFICLVCKVIVIYLKLFIFGMT